MEQNIFKKLLALSVVVALTAATLTGCGQPATDVPPSSSSPSLSSSPSSLSSSPPSSSLPSSSSASPSSSLSSEAASSTDISSTENVSEGSSSTESLSATELYVQFGDNGAPFTMHLYDNDTAAAIASHVGTADWRIPLYNYEGYDNWEVMQYYDIPSRYEIPSNPESVTTEQAGAVYYSDPNRIVLFYGEAEVSGEYTPVGYFDATPEFVSAIEDNPVLEGWGNKIIHINAEK